MKYFVINENSEFKVVGARGFIPPNSIGELPGGIAKEDHEYVTAIETSPGEWNITVDATAKALGDAAKQKAQDRNIARMNKQAAIAHQAQVVFPDIKIEDLLLKVEVWRHMSANAAKFMGLGLKVKEQVNAADNSELFSPGSALDTPAKIKQYADRKLEIYEDFLTQLALAEQVFEDAVSGA